MSATWSEENIGRDSVMGDLQLLGVSDGWFVLAQEREQWRRLRSQQQPQPAVARELVCECGRQFRHRNDIIYRCCDIITTSEIQQSSMTIIVYDDGSPKVQKVCMCV